MCDYVLCCVCRYVLCCVCAVWCACVDSKRLRVYIQNVPVYAGNTRTCGGRRQFCLPKFAHVGLSLDPRGPPKKPMDLTHFQFENRSRATRCRFLQSFAVPDRAVQFQQILGDTAEGISCDMVRFVSSLLSLFHHNNHNTQQPQ